MAFTTIPTRTSADTAIPYQDTNSLMANTQYFKDAITVSSGDIGLGVTPISGNNLDIYDATHAKIVVRSTSANDASIELNESGGEFGVTGTNGFRILDNGGDNKIYYETCAGAVVTTLMIQDRATGYTGIGVAPSYLLHVAGDAYFTADVSALTFTDRTPFYKGDALSEIKKIKGKNGEIDHKTLPEFAKVEKIKKEIIDEKEVEVIELNRDLGAMISILTIAVQQITDRLEDLEKK